MVIIMVSLYDRAEMYDLIESEKRSEIIRRDWKQFVASFAGEID